MSDPKRLFVRPDNTVVLTCPHCSVQREVLVDLFRGKRKINIKCCQRFSVVLEFRKRIRKKAHLKGTYINHSQNNEEGFLTIRDLSISGLSFSCFKFYLFKVGDKLTIDFMLDDEHQSEITKEVVVRDVRKNSVGCEFLSGDEFSFGGPLGHYIMHAMP